MKRLSVLLVVAFFVGWVAAMTFAGCSKAADRTVTIHQLQSTMTRAGQFQIDTSQLPSDAVEQSVDTGSPGHEVKRIFLKMDYDIEIVLRPVVVKPAQQGSITHSTSE